MPILHEDGLIGRVDPRVDREKDAFVVNAVHLEPGIKGDRTTGRAVARAVDDLAKFTGVSRVELRTAVGLPGLGQSGFFTTRRPSSSSSSSLSAAGASRSGS